MLLLEGERCRVRSWRGSDLESIVRHANNPKVAMQLRDRFPHPYTRADGLAFLRHMTGPEPQTNFAIEVDGEAAGAIGFVRGADVERFSAEIGCPNPVPASLNEGPGHGQTARHPSW